MADQSDRNCVVPARQGMTAELDRGRSKNISLPVRGRDGFRIQRRQSDWYRETRMCLPTWFHLDEESAFCTSDSSQYGDNRSLDRCSLRNVSPKRVGTGYLHHWAQYLLHLCCQRTTAIAAICNEHTDICRRFGGAVAPETAAFFDTECRLCAICESCKALICKVLR
jgi:hypothetical protein